MNRLPDNSPTLSGVKRSDAIYLVVVDRECRGPMPAAIAACGAFAVEVKRLPVGNYCLDEALLFERKTLPDLAASIKDGQLFDQAVRLANARFRAALILEGRSRDLAGSGMRIEAIQGALVTVAMFIGLPLLRTRHAEDTVRTLQFAAHQYRAAICGALPRRGHRPKGKTALQSYVLQGLPGIGPRRAANLIQRFGSIEAALAADADALAEVGGIGSAIARKLRWAVEEPRACYDVPRRRVSSTRLSTPHVIDGRQSSPGLPAPRSRSPLAAASASPGQ